MTTTFSETSKVAFIFYFFIALMEVFCCLTARIEDQSEQRGTHDAPQQVIEVLAQIFSGFSETKLSFSFCSLLWFVNSH